MLVQTLQGMGETALRPLANASGSFRQPQVLRETDHRPWPLPEEPWFMGQVWTDLLFAHWPVPSKALAAVVPSALPLDTYEGEAWLGITPFLVEGLRLRGTPPAPVLSTFPEINVRTYVTVEGRPGIYFLSLDAASWPAVFAARRSYRLPYFRSRITTRRGVMRRTFSARRISDDGPAAEFSAEYGPEGEPLPLRDGALERWLTERYCLYTIDANQRAYRGEIHHPPWPLRPAWLELRENTMARPFGLGLEGAPLLHFSARQDVALWPIRPIAP
jgi:uncharacterized protein YqjF (DUF2071 family)